MGIIFFFKLLIQFSIFAKCSLQISEKVICAGSPNNHVWHLQRSLSETKLDLFGHILTVLNKEVSSSESKSYYPAPFLTDDSGHRGSREELDHSHSWRMKRQLRRRNLSWDILKTPSHSIGSHHSQHPLRPLFFVQGDLNSHLLLLFSLKQILNVLRVSSSSTPRLKSRLSECTFPEKLWMSFFIIQAKHGSDAGKTVWTTF